MIALVTDSTCDLPQEILTLLGVTCIPLYVLFENKPLRDGIDITTADIFKGVDLGADIPTTLPPSVDDFLQIYQQLFDQGAKEIISIHLSSRLSNTVQHARIAAEQFSGRIVIIDSQTISGGIALQVMRARELIDSGLDMFEIRKELDLAKTDMSGRFVVDNLTYLQKNGRVSTAGAFFGNLLAVKPLLKVEEGRIDSIGWVRGHSKVVGELVQFVQQYIRRHRKARIIYLYTDGGAVLLPEIKALLSLLPLSDRGTYSIGPVVATHSGHGTVGIGLEPDYRV